METGRMMHPWRENSIHLGAFCIAVATFAALRVEAAEEETRTFVSYSMRVAEERVGAAFKAGQDFREKDPHLFLLGGITKPWAIVIAPEQEDWILLGESDVQSSVLTLDDFDVALRARSFRPDEDPGVSIDPTLCEACQRAGNVAQCFHLDKQKEQDVRFFAGVENTHFGQVCFEADWMMKRVNFGLDPSPASGIETCYASYVKEGMKSEHICSRYWFYPIVNRVNVLPDFVLLEKYRMGVFTEVLHVEIDGQQMDPDTFHDLASDRFARSFTEHYDEAAKHQPVLDTLRGLTRLGALAAGLVRLDHKPEMRFWLLEYQPRELRTRETVEILRVGDQQLGFQLSGGVRLMALAMRLTKGDATALKDLIMLARPSSESLSWSVEVRMKNGMPVDVAIPDTGTGSDDLVALVQHVQHATFLTMKAEYAAAIECYDQALRLCPTYGQAYSSRGVAHRLLGQFDAARSDYEAAIEHEPSLANSYVNLGVLLMHQQKVSEAKPLFEKALQLSPELAPAHNNLGVIFRLQGDFDKAATEYRKGIEVESKDGFLHYNLGLCLLFAGKPKQAVPVLLRAEELLPNGFPQLHYLAGYSLYLCGRFKEAADAFSQFLRHVDSMERDSRRWWDTREYGQVLSSPVDDIRALPSLSPMSGTTEAVLRTSAQGFLLLIEDEVAVVK